MARRDLSKHDASDYAASELEYVIRKQKRVADPVVPLVTGKESLEEKRVFQNNSNRDVTRVLFISRNSELLNPSQQSLDGYLNISDLFDEVHILILRQGIPPKNPVLRVAENVWIYTATSKISWLMPSAGIRMVEEQLEFATGFRPDLIVARDPFESAMVAYKLSQKYHRPAQLHILDDYSNKNFIIKNKSNIWRLLLPYYTIPKFNSVRTLTEKIKKTVLKKYSIFDIDVLPRYQNYEALINRETHFNLKDKYKPFIFFMLYIGKLDYESTLHQVIDSAQEVLRNPRVGLIVLGDGPARSEFEKRAKTLGVDSQVVFETKASDPVLYLKSANILIVSDTNNKSEELVLKGAASGIPMIMSKTQKREDVFTDGESAFLCEPTETESFTLRINDLLNDINLRNRFISKSQDIIRQKFHNDPSKYQSAYRASIEQAIFIESEESENEQE